MDDNKNNSEIELQNIKSKISPVIKKAEAFIVNTLANVEKASSFLKEIKDMETVVENKRIEFTKPLNQSLRNINDTFKKMKEPLEQARSLLTNKILFWKRNESEKIAREEERRRKIQDAHEKQGHQVNAPIIMEKIENKIGNIQTVKRWTYEIIDFVNVPECYKVIDAIKVNLRIREGERHINGLRIYQEESLSIVNK